MRPESSTRNRKEGWRPTHPSSRRPCDAIHCLINETKMPWPGRLSVCGAGMMASWFPDGDRWDNDPLKKRKRQAAHQRAHRGLRACGWEQGGAKRKTDARTETTGAADPPELSAKNTRPETGKRCRRHRRADAAAEAVRNTDVRPAPTALRSVK